MEDKKVWRSRVRRGECQISLREKKVAEMIRELKNLFPQTAPTLVYNNPWQLLVAVILSARNTDKKVNEVTKKLFRKYKNIEDYKNADLNDLEKDLSNLGLFRQKAKFIKRTAIILSAINITIKFPKQ